MILLIKLYIKLCKIYIIIMEKSNIINANDFLNQISSNVEIDENLENKIKVSKTLCTKEEMEQDTGNISIDADENTEMSVNAIPDLDIVTQTIIEMIEFMNTPAMILKKNNKATFKEFETILYHKYRDLVPSTKIIDLLIEDPVENLQKLILMFERLYKIKTGELNMKNEYECFTEEVNNEYLYPQFGGKEKFQIKMAEQMKNKK
jgi:hypothetical protein